jgi:transcriptional regulator with XRE-family HTH domain
MSKTTQDGAANAGNGPSLKDIRLSLGMSIRGFAKELGCTPKSVQRWEAAGTMPTEKATCDRLDILTGAKRSSEDARQDAIIAAAARELVFRLTHVDAQEVTLRLPDRSTAPADYIEQLTAEARKHITPKAQRQRSSKRTTPKVP